jgi:hypothetical protein
MIDVRLCFPDAIRRSGGAVGLIAMLATAWVPTIAGATDFMSEEELLQTIPGSVINGTSNDGTRWAQSYSAYKNGKKNGIIKVNFGGKKSDSKWFVDKGQWCENWGTGQGCWMVERVDSKSLRMYENGKAKKNLWKLK